MMAMNRIGDVSLTSPRLRGEVGLRSNPGEGDSPRVRMRGESPSPRPPPPQSGGRGSVAQEWGGGGLSASQNAWREPLTPTLSPQERGEGDDPPRLNLNSSR